MMLRDNGDRSRITQTTSKGSNRSITASGSAKVVLKYGDVRSIAEQPTNRRSQAPTFW